MYEKQCDATQTTLGTTWWPDLPCCLEDGHRMETVPDEMFILIATGTIRFPKMATRDRRSHSNYIAIHAISFTCWWVPTFQEDLDFFVVIFCFVLYFYCWLVLFCFVLGRFVLFDCLTVFAFSIPLQQLFLSVQLPQGIRSFLFTTAANFAPIHPRPSLLQHQIKIIRYRYHNNICNVKWWPHPTALWNKVIEIKKKRH